MNNTFGNHIRLTLFGESHGKAVGAVLDGIEAGVKIDEERMNRMMALRKPYGAISTARHESDSVEIVSGVQNGYTCGTPITLLIWNENAQAGAYEAIRNTPRPSHADYVSHVRNSGFEDARGGGHFSGRLTAPICAAGSICMSMLNAKGVYIGSHIASLHGIKDRPFDEEHLLEEIESLSCRTFAVLDETAGKQMEQAIEQAKLAKDSLGGILDTAIIGIPEGIGEPWFDSLESALSHALFSIPALKGIQFGAGFGFEAMKGSEANDPFAYENGRVVTLSNHNGGINGGLSNGMPIRFQTVIKPTPSIGLKQKTVALEKGVNTEIQISGRHDPAIIHRARIAVDALCAIVIADLLACRYGSDYFTHGE